MVGDRRQLTGFALLAALSSLFGFWRSGCWFAGIASWLEYVLDTGHRFLLGCSWAWASHTVAEQQRGWTG